MLWFYMSHALILYVQISLWRIGLKFVRIVNFAKLISLWRIGLKLAKIVKSMNIHSVWRNFVEICHFFTASFFRLKWIRSSSQWRHSISSVRVQWLRDSLKAIPRRNPQPWIIFAVWFDVPEKKQICSTQSLWKT